VYNKQAMQESPIPSDMQKLKDLIKKKDEIEKEIRDITQMLNLQGFLSLNFNMKCYRIRIEGQSC
jgi:hypothetical protein